MASLLYAEIYAAAYYAARTQHDDAVAGVSPGFAWAGHVVVSLLGTAGEVATVRGVWRVQPVVKANHVQAREPLRSSQRATPCPTARLSVLVRCAITGGVRAVPGSSAIGQSAGTCSRLLLPLCLLKGVHN